MKITSNTLNRVEEALAILQSQTYTDPYEIVDALVGVCWGEEEAGEIKEFLSI